MSNTWLLASIAIGVFLIVIPFAYWFFGFWLSKPSGRFADKDAETRYWRQSLWCLAFGMYGIFAFFATMYLGKNNLDTLELWEKSMTISLYVLPLAYILPGIKSYNMTQNGMLFFLNKDVCALDRAFWFVPTGMARTVIFNTTLRQYQFPDDDPNGEKTPIEVNTAEHIVTETNKEDASVVSKITRIGELEENQVLNRILTLTISPFVQFKMINAEVLYTNFSDIYDEEGEEGVALEIARQLRDSLVAEAMELFPTKGAKEIFDKLKEDINPQMKERIQDESGRLGIQLIEARLTTVKFSKQVDELLTSIAQAHATAINAKVKAEGEAAAKRTDNEVKMDLAKMLGDADHGEKLAMILQLEVLKEIGTKGTNYNIGDIGGVNLPALLKKITGGLTN